MISVRRCAFRLGSPFPSDCARARRARMYCSLRRTTRGPGQLKGALMTRSPLTSSLRRLALRRLSPVSRREGPWISLFLSLRPRNALKRTERAPFSLDILIGTFREGFSRDARGPCDRLESSAGRFPAVRVFRSTAIECALSFSLAESALKFHFRYRTNALRSVLLIRNVVAPFERARLSKRISRRQLPARAARALHVSNDATGPGNG